MATPQQLCLLGAINEYVLQQGFTAWNLRVTDPYYKHYQMLLQRIIASNNLLWKTQLQAMTTQYGRLHCPSRFLLYEQLFVAQCMAQCILLVITTLGLPAETWPIFVGMTSPLARMNNIYHNFDVHGEIAVLRAIACLSIVQQDMMSTTVKVNNMDVYAAFLLLEPRDLAALLRRTPDAFKKHPLYLSLQTYLEQHAQTVQSYLGHVDVNMSLNTIETWHPKETTSAFLEMQRHLLDNKNANVGIYAMLLTPFMHIIKLPAYVSGASWSVGVLRAMGIISKRNVKRVGDVDYDCLQGVDVELMFQHIQGMVNYPNTEPWHAFTAERQLQQTLQLHYTDLYKLYEALFKTDMNPIQLVTLTNIPATSYTTLSPVLCDAYGNALRPVV